MDLINHSCFCGKDNYFKELVVVSFFVELNSPAPKGGGSWNIEFRYSLLDAVVIALLEGVFLSLFIRFH